MAEGDVIGPMFVLVQPQSRGYIRDVGAPRMVGFPFPTIRDTLLFVRVSPPFLSASIFVHPEVD